MANELPHAVAAIRDVVLADGKTYRMSPLDLKAWGEIDLWLEGYIKQRAARVYADAPAAIKDEGLRVAFARANKVSFANVDGMMLLTTPEGTARVLWHALRKEYPSLTIDEVKGLWTDEVGREIERRLEEANRLVDPTGAKMSPETPTPTPTLTSP